MSRILRTLILCCSLVAACWPAYSAEPTWTELPTPPQQQAAWTPPKTALPPTLLTATSALFEEGMADPRGCPYCEISVLTGSCWGGAGEVKTHGWVLPAKAGETQRFGVCWNGLVYPLLAVGKAADLKADMLALVQADEQMRAEQHKRSPGNPFYRGLNNAIAEGNSIEPEMMTPVKVCLLLRLGEETLAGKVWSAWMIGYQPLEPMNGNKESDPYLMLATDWVWAMFDRAVCAHMRGDDHLSAADARALVHIQPLVEAMAEKREFRRPYAQDDHGHEIRNGPYLDFLKELPRLVADEERRVKTPRPAAFSPDAITEMPDNSKRIAALIDALDEVSVHQNGQPGWVNLEEDPLVAALLEEGEDAVEPLLARFESEDRLTRSVSFGRSFHRGRSLIGAASAEYKALVGILNTSEFSSREEHLERKALAARMRAYWTKNRGIPLEERWYNMLADDNATPAQWVEAANFIIQPSNESRVPGSSLSRVAPLKPGEKPTLRGESLRGKHDPSVSALLEKRILSLITANEGQPLSDAQSRDASSLITALAKWAGKEALPALRTFSAQYRQHVDKEATGTYPYPYNLGNGYVDTVLLRAKYQDRDALKEYAAWLHSLTKAKGLSLDIHLFQPLCDYATDPAMIDTAHWLFTDEQSPLRKDKIIEQGRSQELLDSPWLGVEGFRVALVKLLSDTTEAGSLSLSAGNYLTMKRKEMGGSSSYPAPFGDPLLPKPNVEIPFRRCDEIANALVQVEGMPRCEVYWPKAERDKAIAAIITHLSHYGNNYRKNPDLPKRDYWEGFPHDMARLSFSHLDHPATAQDVAEGRAIFSLGTTIPVRMYHLPAVPLKGKWVTLKKYPSEGQSYDPKTKVSTKTINYNQTVMVWQAEEVLQDGKWQRYYGVVGPHELARVPAEEIEFEVDEPWQHGALPGGIDCTLALPDGNRYPLDVPKSLCLILRNRRGIERSVPTEWYQPTPALRNGLELHASYSPTDMRKARRDVAPQFSELTLTRTTHFTPGKVSKILAPLEEFTAFEFNPADWFDLSKPGTYMLWLQSTTASGLGEGRSNEVRFVVGKGR